MEKHTPGPWTYELDLVDEGDINVFVDGEPAKGLPGCPIAAVDVLSEPGAEDGPPREQALANAALIAAAPNLLKALCDLVAAAEASDNPYDQGLSSNSDEMERARIAILVAKAEGRQ